MRETSEAQEYARRESGGPARLSVGRRREGNDAVGATTSANGMAHGGKGVQGRSDRTRGSGIPCVTGRSASVDTAFGCLRSEQFLSANTSDDEHPPKQSGRPPDDEQSAEQSDRIPKTLGEQPPGDAAEPAQTRDNNGQGGNDGFAPQSQDQGRGFYRDFARPGCAGRLQANDSK